jgi:hypothetical protein
MAIMYMNGFEGGLETNRWTAWLSAPEVNSTFARHGGLGMRAGDTISAYLWKTVTLVDDTLAYSFGINIRGIGNNDSFIRDAWGSGWDLRWYTGDNIGITTGAGTFITTSGLFPTLAYHWVEAEIFYHASTGTAKVWLNGDLVIDESGLNTGTRPGSASGILGGTQTSHILDGWYDDFVISDGSGTYNNTRPLGDSAIRALAPEDNGNSSLLLGSDGNKVNNYLLVDEVPEPDTADYVGSALEGDKDLYVLSDLPSASAAVLAVQVEQYSQKTDVGSKWGRTVLRTNSIDYPQTSVALPASWGHEITILEENPDTVSAWTAPNVNALEAGFEVRDS